VWRDPAERDARRGGYARMSPAQAARNADAGTSVGGRADSARARESSASSRPAGSRPMRNEASACCSAGVRRTETGLRTLMTIPFGFPTPTPAKRDAPTSTPSPMKVHMFAHAQVVPRPPHEVFEFFADAHNLEAITPPWLRFRIVTRRPIEMGEGTMLEYRLELHRIPLRWLTRIEVWEPGRRFVDVQVRGPYRLWEHTHRFAAHVGGTLVEDTVRYALPLGPLGRLAHAAFVARDLRRIFDYRRAAVATRLDSMGPRRS
jgi:ligand-binding SRPBCC domain-containing protein